MIGSFGFRKSDERKMKLIYANDGHSIGNAFDRDQFADYQRRPDHAQIKSLSLSFNLK